MYVTEQSAFQRFSQRQANDHVKGLNKERLMVAPVVGGNIVVAAMQIPYIRDREHNWQGLDIIKP